MASNQRLYIYIYIYIIGILIHAAIRSKIKDWLAQNQNNVC